MRRTDSSCALCLLWAATLVMVVAVWGCGRTTAPGRAGRYEDLVALFKAWRSFQAPVLVDGVPDYRPAAMTAQYRELASWRARLAAIDTTGWPIVQQADWHAVRAEMNGLDFDHRVLKPWANNPAFYVTAFGGESDQPAREGPLAAGAVDLWAVRWPLSAADAEALAPRIRAIPRLLDQARAT